METNENETEQFRPFMDAVMKSFGILTFLSPLNLPGSDVALLIGNR